MKFRKSFFISKPAVAAFTALLLVLVFNTANAQQTAIDENPDEVRVKYIDGDNDALYFNLKYDNNSGSDFNLMVISETGDVLFQNNYSGKKFRKNLKLPRLTDTDGLTFLIKPAKKNIQLRYKVKVTDKVEDNTSIADK